MHKVIIFAIFVIICLSTISTVTDAQTIYYNGVYIVNDCSTPITYYMNDDHSNQKDFRTLQPNKGRCYYYSGTANARGRFWIVRFDKDFGGGANMQNIKLSPWYVQGSPYQKPSCHKFFKYAFKCHGNSIRVVKIGPPNKAQRISSTSQSTSTFTRPRGKVDLSNMCTSVNNLLTAYQNIANTYKSNTSSGWKGVSITLMTAGIAGSKYFYDENYKKQRKWAHKVGDKDGLNTLRSFHNHVTNAMNNCTQAGISSMISQAGNSQEIASTIHRRCIRPLKTAQNTYCK